MLIFKIIYHCIAMIKKILLKMIYGRKVNIQKGVTWRKDFSMMIGKTGKVSIGENCFFNNYCSINSLNNIYIGSNTIMGENVKVYDHNHRFNIENTLISEQGFSVGEVSIGENCWIGSNVIILKDAKIGNNCVIAAGSVINDVIPDNSIVRNNTKIDIEKINFIKGNIG